MLQKVLDTAAERDWLVTSVNVETMTEASFLKVFQDLDKRKEGQIIIDCETERLTGILKKVTNSSLFFQKLCHLIAHTQLPHKKTLHIACHVLQILHEEKFLAKLVHPGFCRKRFS